MMCVKKANYIKYPCSVSYDVYHRIIIVWFRIYYPYIREETKVRTTKIGLAPTLIDSFIPSSDHSNHALGGNKFADMF